MRRFKELAAARDKQIADQREVPVATDSASAADGAVPGNAAQSAA